MRQFKAAQFTDGCVGEGAPFVTKEFGFDERGRERGAVYGNQRLVLARRESMNGLSHQFLACPGFPGDENGGIGRRDLLNGLQRFLQRGAVADQACQVERGTHLLTQIDIFLFQLILELTDLVVGREIGDRVRQVKADLFGQRQVAFGEGVPPSASDRQKAVRRSPDEQRAEHGREHAE